MPYPLRRFCRILPVIALSSIAVGGMAAAGTAPPAVVARREPLLRARRLADGPAARTTTLDVRLDGERVTQGLRSLTVLPGAGVRIEVAAEQGAELRYQDGSVSAAGEGAWRWIAPVRPGIYALRVATPTDSLELTALVLHPAGAVRNGVLNGYRIGSYKQKPLKDDAAYLPPMGFVEVAAGDRDVLVSPRFTLGQFLCKQPGEPRYAALSIPLLQKLEVLSDLLEERGYPAGSLRVMSGFRTPAYNAAIGNQTVYSRHLWGDAADVFVDADGDGDMDDLTGDGRSTVADARLLAEWVDGLEARGAWSPGGVGVYRRNAAHGPFVHVDARGSRARW